MLMTMRAWKQQQHLEVLSDSTQRVCLAVSCLTHERTTEQLVRASVALQIFLSLDFSAILQSDNIAARFFDPLNFTCILMHPRRWHIIIHLWIKVVFLKEWTGA